MAFQANKQMPLSVGTRLWHHHHHTTHTFNIYEWSTLRAHTHTHTYNHSPAAPADSYRLAPGCFSGYHVFLKWVSSRSHRVRCRRAAHRQKKASHADAVRARLSLSVFFVCWLVRSKPRLDLSEPCAHTWIILPFHFFCGKWILSAPNGMQSEVCTCNELLATDTFNKWCASWKDLNCVEGAPT